MPTLKWRNAYLYWDGDFVTEGVAISISFDREWIEDTSYGDSNRTYKPGFGDFEMTVRRHYEQAGLFSLEGDAIDASPTAKDFYMYPDRSVATDYWYGSGYVSLDEQGGDMSGLWDESYSIRAAEQVFHRTS